MYDKDTYLWSACVLSEITYICLNKFQYLNITYNVMSESIRTVAAVCLKEPEEIFFSKHII